MTLSELLRSFYKKHTEKRLEEVFGVRKERRTMLTHRNRKMTRADVVVSILPPAYNNCRIRKAIRGYVSGSRTKSCISHDKEKSIISFFELPFVAHEIGSTNERPLIKSKCKQTLFDKALKMCDKKRIMRRNGKLGGVSNMYVYDTTLDSAMRKKRHSKLMTQPIPEQESKWSKLA